MRSSQGPYHVLSPHGNSETIWATVLALIMHGLAVDGSHGRVRVVCHRQGNIVPAPVHVRRHALRTYRCFRSSPSHKADDIMPT